MVTFDSNSELNDHNELISKYFDMRFCLEKFFSKTFLKSAMSCCTENLNFKGDCGFVHDPVHQQVLLNITFYEGMFEISLHCCGIFLFLPIFIYIFY